MQQRAQRAQEAVQVAQQLLGLQPHHDDQRAGDELGREVDRAVHAVPVARCVVAAPVADAVAVVVLAVVAIPGEKGEKVFGDLAKLN